MPEEDKGQKPTPSETTPQTTPATEPEDELLSMIKSDPQRAYREIKDLRDEAATNRRKAKKADEDRVAAEKKKLEEDGQYRELSETQAQEIADLRASIRKDKIESAVLLEATAARIKDPADALKLADLSKVDVSETGVVSGAKEAIAELVKAKSYLVANESPSGGTEKPTPAAPAINPTNPGGGPKLTPEGLGKMSIAEIAAMTPEERAAALTNRS